MSQKELVKKLIIENVLSSPEIIRAFQKVDRKDFVLPKFKDSAYGDFPLSIGFDQTISQPSTVAFMLELLKVEKGENVLDVGSGSGWTTALLSKLTGSKGKVTGVEIIPELVQLGTENLSKTGVKNTEIYQAQNVIGYEENSPYDKILVSASATKLPQDLLDQLETGGRILIPVGNSIWLVDKVKDKEIRRREYFGFAFVPLVDVRRQKP